MKLGLGASSKEGLRSLAHPSVGKRSRTKISFKDFFILQAYPSSLMFFKIFF
jgi:hypothetical protein